MIIVNVRYLLIRSRCRSSGTKYINRECEPTTISTSNPAYPKEIILENISSRELNRLRMQIVPYNGPTIPSHKVAAFSLPRIHTHSEHLPNRYPLYENVKIKILCKTPQSGAFFFSSNRKRGTKWRFRDGSEEKKMYDVRFQLHRLFTQTAYREFHCTRYGKK